MIEEALKGLIQDGVLGILCVILMVTIRFIYLYTEKKYTEREKVTDATAVKREEDHDAEKDRMREDIRRILDKKEAEQKEERMGYLTQIRELIGELKG